MLCFIFLSDDSKQDFATTTAHRKRLIELLEEQKLLALSLIIILKILMVVQSNIYVPHHYTLYQLCHNITQL